MLRIAFKMGLPPSEFWGLTFWEFEACLEGYKERTKDNTRDILWAACVVANRIPNFSKQHIPTLTPEKLMGIEE